MEDTSEVPAQDARAGDRRRKDRRRSDRRTPPPAWRRPWAFVAYGVLGTFLVVMALRLSGEPPVQNGAIAGEVIAAPPAHDVSHADLPAASRPPLDARSPGAFAQLVAQGGNARGQLVNTEIFCSPITSVSLRNVPEIPSQVVELSDVDGRVPAAECKWGSATAAPDFLLLIPPSLADGFAAAPIVEDGFVRRHRLDIQLEWLGRSDALSLRTAGILRTIR